MKKLSQTAPLKVIQIKDKVRQQQEVQLHIHDPIFIHQKRNKKLQLLNQLSQLELLLEKKNRLEIWKSKREIKNMDSTLQRLYQIVSRTQVSTLRQDILLQDKEFRIKLKQLYPRVFVLLSDDDFGQQQQLQQYQSLSHLNELYVIATRFYYHLNSSNHQYIPYQLALLYQCINRQGVHFINYKLKIEQRFDKVKQVTKTKDDQLESNQISWLKSLALDIIMQIIISIYKYDTFFNN
ncbi:uncharacterized protein BX663DRAFT_509825 [Cokeromyces recurvatus]|uniref:uncharacterized protein n=1 Tax=Cokeromyces recurvatus TaxID=90255 RepID=UPI00221FD75B|nr:uncharacterized protein BX663DRAFT_509825 [Cokeromyces recurvatus]KAI7902606.1 hypothetical protein BX663DRAFT_509825 [Cokeromyces recurvatus]